MAFHKLGSDSQTQAEAAAAATTAMAKMLNNNFQLKLNEALLLVNKINLTDPVEVYYQLEECFGCPPDKLEPQARLGNDGALQEQFIIGTQHNFNLGIRELESVNTSTKRWCQLDDVSFNSYGQYRLDVSPQTDQPAEPNHSPRSSNQKLRCALTTIDPGECLLCPLAILICILLAVIAGEQIYQKLQLHGRRRSTQYGRADRKLSSASINSQPGDVIDPASLGDGGGQASGDSRESNALNLDDPSVARRESSHSHQPTTRDMGDDSNSNNIETTARDSRGVRVESLDIFRGLTLAGMIFVNYGGAGYAMLEHTAWNGLTLADFVFPFFIFSMGASVAIAVRGLIKSSQRSIREASLKILRRSAILAVLGICLNSKWVKYDQADGLERLRLTGVLQRFSLSYLIVALMYCFELKINEWTRAQSLSNVPYLRQLIRISFELLTAINYGAFYVYMTLFFQFDPNCPVGYLGPGGETDGAKYANCTGGAAAWLDRMFLGTDHMYNDRDVKLVFKTQISHDPEGILGYSTSILLTLVGLQCGKILINRRGTHKQKILALGQWALAMALSSGLVVFIPINKRLWSLTFITVTGFAALIIMIMLYILLDVYSCKQSILVRLLSAAGKNSIFLYVGHSLIQQMLPFWFPLAPNATHLQTLLRLTWSTLVWLLIAHFMALKKIFIRI